MHVNDSRAGGVTVTGLRSAMDLTFVLSAVIFTLLAIVVATSLLNGSPSTTDFANARRYFGSAGGLDQPGPKQNGHVPDKKKKKKEAEDDWCEISGSSHDHWDVVKSVLSVSRLQSQFTQWVRSGGLFAFALRNSLLICLTASASH